MSTIYTTRAERRAALRAKSATVLTPGVRRWGYGVAVAAVGLAIWAGWLPPTAAPVVVPLCMALFFVDDQGNPKP